MNKQTRLSIFTNGILRENPVFVLVLGTCATLAQTASIISALGMGVATMLVLIGSNVAISAMRRLIPDTVRIPCYIVIVAVFVTVVQLLMHAYLPDLYDMMGVFLALIVVNCIILGRAEMFAGKNGVLDSALDGAGMGVGFVVALLAMALIRETLGCGTFAGFAIPVLDRYHIPILAQAPGGFLVFGILIALMNHLRTKRGAPVRREFSCEGCPSAALCGRASCSEMSELSVDVRPAGAKNPPSDKTDA